jgi:hypothetical protein
MRFFSWEVFFGIGALLVLAAITWGAITNSRRNKANDKVTEEAAKALQEHPDTYNEEIRPKLKEKIKP